MICDICGELVTPAEQRWSSRIPLHRECATRALVGGANHLLGRCSCFGGTANEDPPELTPRQAAVVAAGVFLVQQRLEFDRAQAEAELATEPESEPSSRLH